MVYILGNVMHLVIIVPAYNETQHLGRVCRGLFEQNSRLTELGFKRITTVVVDDGSTDATAEIARCEGAVVIRHPLNRGQGAALETGDEYARVIGADVAVHFDADGQFNPGDVAPAVQALLTSGKEVILGSRWLGRPARGVPFVKRILLRTVGRWFTYLQTGVWLTDFHNGFRVFNRRALSLIRLTHDGMAHNAEIIAALRRHRLTFAEWPVEVTYHEYGQGVRGGAKIFWDLLWENFR